MFHHLYSLMTQGASAKMKRSIFAILRLFSALAVCLSMAWGSGSALAAPLPLQISHPDVPLGGKPNRFDYETVDPQHRLLFVAQLGSGMVTVFDLRTNRVIANIKKIPAVHGVLAVPSLDEVFASATGQNRLDVISEKTFHVIAQAPAGVYPDGMTYAPPEHELFISDEGGKTETVVDTRTNKRLATIPMGGEVGNSQYDPVTGLVFVDVQTRDDIVSIDPKTSRITHRYPLPAICKDDHGLLLDAPARLAFVACDDDAKLLVLDMRTMHVLSVHKTGSGPDVLAFDAGLRRLYVASESGIVAIFQLQGNSLHLLGRSYLAYEAHSVAIDPLTHWAYFPLQDVGGIGVMRIMAPTP
jgi:DNA-binding beta-propeller fold protein YncE